MKDTFLSLIVQIFSFLEMCNGSDAEVKSGISPACLHNHASKFLSPKRTWRSSSTSLCEIQNLPVVINSYSSPTENLPNIVIDNMTTPIQKSSKSASKMHSKKWNWLTKYAANISQNNIYTSSSLSKRSKLSKKRHSKIKIGRRLEDYFT